MAKSKIFTYLRCFSKKELKQFEFFFKQNYGQTRAFRTLKGLIHIHPDFSLLQEKHHFDELFLKTFEKSIDRSSEAVYQNCRRQLFNTFSDLNIKVKDFLAFQAFQSNRVFQEFLYLNQLIKYPELKAELKRSLKRFPSSGNFKNKELDTYASLLKITLHHFALYNLPTDKLNANTDLPETNKYLEQLFITHRLKYACELFSRAKILGETVQIEFLDSVLAFLEKQSTFSSLKQELYYYALLMIQKDSIHYYELLEKKFINNKKLPLEDHRILLTFLLNFCNNQLKLKNLGFIQNMFYLYQYDLEFRKPLKDEKITDIRLLNILQIAFSLKQKEWALKFVKDWEKKILSPYKKSTIELAYAQIAFEFENYQKALNLSDKKRYPNLFFALRGRSIALCSYYMIFKDTPQNPNIDLKCSAFEKYVRTKSNIKPTEKMGALSLISFIQKMTDGSTPFDKLLKELKKRQYTFFNSWLTQQLSAENPFERNTKKN